MIFIIMGVCGSGKTTVGEALARKIGCVFRDADVFHPEENRKKMSQGIPLNDEDRYPWLQAIHEYIVSLMAEKKNGVVTCSALKKSYRDILRKGKTGDSTTENSSVVFVCLKGSRSLLQERMGKRTCHFMPATLLDSQLEILELPDETEDHIAVDIEGRVDEIVSEILRMLKPTFADRL